MNYVEVKNVPLYRDSNPVKYLVSAIASRLTSPEITLEVRLETKGGKIGCYIGTDSAVTIKQAIKALHNGGYSLTPTSNVAPLPKISDILIRKVDIRNKLIPGKPPVQTFMIHELTYDTNRFESIYSTLRDIRSDCGLVMLIRKNAGLDISAYNRLLQDDNDNPVLNDIFSASELFEIIVGVYGNNSTDVEWLISEIMYAFPGLISKKLDPILGTKGIFGAYKSNLPENLKSLETLYTVFESETLTNLNCSAGCYGLPINKDTLFGVPETINPNDGKEEHNKNEQLLIFGYSSNNTPYGIPLKQLRKHVFISGEPGSGKGNELFNLAYQLHKYGIPLLMIESAKKEQHHLAKVIPDLKVWRPTESEFIYNPFRIPDRIKLKDYRASLLQTLRVCFKLDGPLEELFSNALNNCFVRYGYTDDSYVTEKDVFRFGLNEFIEEYTALLDAEKYSTKTKQDMKTAGLVRLNSLFNENKAVFDTVNSIPVSELTKGENLIQLNCIPAIESKQLFATMLLIALSAYLRLCCNTLTDRPLRLVIMLDESHNLLKAVNNTSGEAYNFAQDFYNLLLELRSLGIGVIMADQSTNNIPSCLSEVCATKVFFGCSPFNGLVQNREYFKADDTVLDNMYLLTPGEACFYTYGMKRGTYIYCPNIIDKFSLNEEYSPENKYLRNHARLMIETFSECSLCPARGQCTFSNKTSSRQLAGKLILNYKAEVLDSMAEKERINNTVADIASAIFGSVKCREEAYCTAVQFVREFNRVSSKKLAIESVLDLMELVWNKIIKNKTQGGKQNV